MSMIVPHGRESDTPVADPDEGNEMNPNEIDLDTAQAEQIGFASSREDGRARWTELRVFFLHNPPSRGRPWLSEALGCTVVTDEAMRVRRLNVGSLERALKLFEDSDLGVIVSEEARDWAETAIVGAIGDGATETLGFKKQIEVAEYGRRVQHVDATEFPQSELCGFEDEPLSEANALAWLYGQPDSAKASFAAMLARDMGMTPNAVTTALRKGQPIRVPLMKLLPFLDRAAFRAARKREKGDA